MRTQTRKRKVWVEICNTLNCEENFYKTFSLSATFTCVWRWGGGL